jgi:hypothetical protein
MARTKLIWLFGRTDKDALERRVEPACDSGNLFIVELAKCGRWLVVFEDTMSVIILVEHYPDRWIKRRRESMSRHQRSRNWVADVILERHPRPTRDLRQRAMIARQEIDNSGPLSFREFARSTSPFAKSSKTVGSSCGTVLSSAVRTSMNDFVDSIVICSIDTVRFAIVGMISKPFDIRSLLLVAPHGTELCRELRPQETRRRQAYPLNL